MHVYMYVCTVCRARPAPPLHNAPIVLDSAQETVDGRGAAKLCVSVYDKS